MTYSVSRNEAGDFVVCELRPVVLGRFGDEAMAAIFLDALTHLQGQQLTMALEVPADAVPPRRQEAAPPPVARIPLPMPAQEAASDAPAELLPLLSPAATLTVPDIPAETLEEAFRRLDGGERLADVAVALTISVGRLRGHWALECKKRRAAAQGEIAKVPCRLCGAEFVPSGLNMETCARCSR